MCGGTGVMIRNPYSSSKAVWIASVTHECSDPVLSAPAFQKNLHHRKSMQAAGTPKMSRKMGSSSPTV